MHGGGVTLYSMYNLEPNEKVRKKKATANANK
jgi:hypothetical protein